MRRIVAICTLFALAVALIPALTARAAGPDVTRPVDGVLRLCPQGFKCTARAVGDVNGDKMDDVVFEVTRLGTTNPEVGAARRFDLVLSPYVPDTGEGRDARDRRGTNVVQFFLDGGQGVDPVTVADINSDGRADLVFPLAGSADRGDSLVLDRATVVLGRASGWSKRYKLDGATVAAGVTLVQRPDNPEAEPVPTSRELSASTLALQSADVNQDGHSDLILAVDAQFVDVSRSSGIGLRGGGALRQRSTVYIQFGRGALPTMKVNFQPDVTITGLGPCTLGLAGTGDVTGDHIADLVLRRCQTAGAPPQLRVVAGRQQWPPQLTADGVGAPAAPNILPTPTPIAPEPTAEPPPPGGGYLPSPSSGGEVALPAQVRVLDVSGDGIQDITLEFAGKTHLWFGGAPIVERVAANRTYGAYLKAGYGALPLTRTWRTVDLDADGNKDLLLSKSIDPALLVCPAGTCQIKSKPDANGRPLYLYTGSHATRRVVDLEMDTADAMWNDPANVIWGIGDFNADGKDDLLMGSSPAAFDSVYALVYGPLAK